MNTSSNGYVLGFAIGVCVVISAALALTSAALKDTQDAAAEFDRQKNVMMAAGQLKAGDTRSRQELEQAYKDNVREILIDTETGKEATDKKVEDRAKMSEADQKRYRMLAIAKGADGKPEAYVLPISGKGLWSTLYGYLALGADATTVKGLTFYKHGETPGLGGECENPEWTAKWVGKSILEGDKLTGIVVKKGVVDPAVPFEKAHMVDGLSGATITCNGINKFVKSDLKAFDTFLGPIRKK